MKVTINAKADRAEMLIYEDIGAGWFGDGLTAKTFAKELKALGGVKTLDVRLNSGGGDVFEGMTIYRQLADHSAHVNIHIDGLAASIASVIAMAGKTISIAESGFLMIHDAWGMAMGGSQEMRRTADLLDSTSAAIADVYHKRSGMPLDEIRALMADETWMTAGEAMERKLVTDVAENVRMAASVDVSRFKFRKPAPVALKPAPDLSNTVAWQQVQAMRLRVTAARQKFTARGAS